MFLKSKKFWIGIGIFLVLVLFLYPKEKSILYEVIKVERGDLVQTVDVTGKIKSENNIFLYFEASGIIDRIYVAEGERVRRGDVLAKLNLDNLNFLIKQAEANLNQKVAGVSEEQINVSQKQIDSAEIAYRKAELNLENVKSLGEENLRSRYISMVDILDDTYIKLFDVLKFSENVKDLYFSGLSQEDISIKNDIEYKIKENVNMAKDCLDNAKETKSIEDIQNAFLKIDQSVKEAVETLLHIKSASEGVKYKDIILPTIKTALDQNKLTLSNSQITLTNLQNEVSLLKLQNENNINASKVLLEEAEAYLELQKANHELLIAPLRDVDLAYLRSVLDQAVLNRNKAIIYSPLEGVITKVNKKQGELISMAEPVFEILSPKYQVEVNIPETDIIKINVGDKADMKLDAIENITFLSEVTSINPASTSIQDVVYYKVILSILEEDSRVKPGMTADILIYTDKREDVLYILSRGILTDKERKFVRVLNEDGEIIEKDIEVGLSADDGKREILSGVLEGEEIVLKIKDAN